jgi:hypothetical protein
MRKYLKYLPILLLIPFIMAVSLRVTNEGGGVGISVVNTRSSSLTFDGTDDYVDCGNGALLNITGTVTLALWHRSDTRDSGGIAGKWASNEGYMIYRLASKKYTNYLNAAYIESSPYNDNDWHHIAIVWNGTNGYIYVDGQDDTQITIGTLANPISHNGIFTIGAYSTGSEETQGTTVDVRVFNRALTPVEIGRIHRGEIITDGLVSGYPLQEGGLSEVAYDVSGNGNHGDLTNFTLSDGWKYQQNVSHYNQQMGHSTEILGSELFTNADFEGGFTGGLADGWSRAYASQTYTDEIIIIHGGSHAQKITVVADDEGQGILQSKSITDGKEYYIEVWIYASNASNVRLWSANLNGGVTQVVDITIADTWQKITWYATGTTTGAAYIWVYQHPDSCTTSDYLIIDDISMKEITNDVPDGAKVPSLADGSGIDAIGNAINNPGRGYNKSLLNVTN